MKTAQITKRLLLVTLCLGLYGGMSTVVDAAQYRVQVKNPINGRRIDDRVYSNATLAAKRAAVLASEYWVLYKSAQSKGYAFQNGGTYQNAKIIQQKLQKLGHKALLSRKRTSVITESPKPPPQNTKSYVVTRYHPLTKKLIHRQFFMNKEAAVASHKHNNKIWWVFVYNTKSGHRAPKEYRGSQAVCQRMASNINRKRGQRALALRPVIKMTRQ